MKGIKLKYILPALKEQLPFRRFIKNFFITRNAWGMFHKNSHYRSDSSDEKIGLSKKKAIKAADRLSKKHNKKFSCYRCCFCGKFHIGKTRVT